MRTSTLLLSLLLIPFLSFSQQRTSLPALELEQRVAPFPDGEPRVVNDTLLPVIFGDTCAATVLTYLSTGNWGFVSGTNGFGDKEKAERMDYSTTANIDILAVWAFFSVAIPVGDGIVQFNLYDTDAGGGPGSLIGNTSSSRVSGLGVSDTAVIATIFPVVGQVSLSGESSFFASLDISGIYATNDTVGLFSTKENCGDATSSWEKFSDDTWVNMSSQDTWGLILDLYLASVISFDETSSVNDAFSMEGLSLHPAFPNPASDVLTLSFDLETSRQVSIEVYDLQGRRLITEDLGILTPGNHQSSISTSSLAAGLYTYFVKTSDGMIGEKFSTR